MGTINLQKEENDEQNGPGSKVKEKELNHRENVSIMFKIQDQQMHKHIMIMHKKEVIKDKLIKNLK